MRADYSSGVTDAFVRIDMVTHSKVLRLWRYGHGPCLHSGGLRALWLM
jgi:hypothetical protein